MPPKGKKGGNGAKKGKDRRRMNTESSTESTGVDADFVPSKLKSPKKEKPESLEDPVPSSSNGAAAADDTAGDAALAQQLAGAEAEAPLRRSRRQCSAIGKLLISDQVEDSRIHAKKEAAASKSANRHALDHYDFDRLCTDPKFDKPEMFRRMEPEEFTMDYYNESGLNEVLMFKCPPEKLGMKMAGKDFTVRDVERLCGPEMKIACVKVEKQETVHMKLKNFISYYYKDEAARKGELYNVLSLEFSNTELAELVRSPELVRKIDWMRYWPDSKKHRHVTFEKDGGYTTEVHYPRVSNYCLMSVQKCYTDFHIDFYGTSVWYHVHTGKKIFWIMRPTAHNLQLYEEYLKTPDSFSFLGDTLECARVVIEPGCTVIIPSGWIHAVYTPVDSLVFGGNFLHIRQIDMQLCVAAGERRIGIGKKYLYPYSEEALFFTIADKVKKVTGRMYVRPDTRNKQDHWLEYVGEKWMAKNEHRREPKKADYKEGGAVWDARWEEDEEYLDTMKKFAQYEKETSEGERVAAGAPSLNDTGLEDETEEPDTDEERKAIKMEIDSEQASTSTAIPAGEFQIKKEETDVFAFTDDMPQLQKAVSSSSLPVKRTSGGAAMAPSLQAEEHSPSQSGSQGDASSIADDDTANDVKPFAKRASAGTKISYNDQISEDDRLAWEEKAKKADRHHLEKTPDGTPHDDFFIDDTTFFHPESFGVEPSPEDRKNGQQFVHMWAVSEKEPALRIDEEALAREIHPREIYQLEYILYHLLGKHSVDVPFGMSRPNSLLKAFRDILVRRRAQLAEQGVEVESISPIEGKVKEFPAVVLDPQIPVVRKRVSFKTWFNPDEVGLTPVSPRKSHKKKASVSGGSMDSSKDLKRKSKTMFEKMEEEDSDYSESAASSGFHSPSPVKTKKRKSTESDLRRTVITPSNGAPRQQSWRPNVTPPVPGSGLQPLPSGYRFAVGRGSIGTGQGLQPMAHRSNQPSNSFGIRRNTGALVYRVAVSRPNAPNTTGFSAPASYTGRPPILNVQRAPTQPPVRHYGSQQRHSFGGTPFRPAASRPPLWSPYRGVMPVAKARSATQSSIKMPQDKIGMAEVLNKARELYIKSKSEAPAYALLPDDERTATLTVKWEKEERSVKDAMINKATQEEIAVRMTETFGHSPDTARNVVAILKDSARFEAAVAALNPKENGNADTSLDEEHISEALDDTVLNEDTLSDAAAPDAMEQQAQPSSIDAQSPTQSQADHGDTMRIVREFNKYYAEKRIRYRERFPYLNEVDRRLRAFNEWTIREATGKSPSKRLKVICSDDASIEQERKKRANFAKQKYAKAIEIWFREEGHEHAESIGLKGKNIREQARKEIYNNLPDSEKEKWKAKARESLKKEEIAIYGGPNYNGPLFRRDPGAPPPREVPTLSDVLKGELGSPLGAGGGDVSGAVNRSYIVGPASAIIAEFATDINHRALILGPNAPAMKPQRTALLNTVVVRLRAQCNLDLDADKVDRHIKYLLKKAREYDGVIRKGGDPSKIFGKLEEPSKNAILIMHAWQKHKGESMPMDDVYKSSLIGDMSHQQQQLAQRQQQLHQERMLENGLLEIGIGAAAGGGAGGIGDFQRQHSSSAHMATQPNLQNLMALFPGAAPRMPFDIPGVSQAQPIPQQPPGGLINMGYQGPGHMEHLIGRTSSSGAGAVTGFDVFCKEHRPSKPDHMDPRDFKKRLQGVWDQMSHNDKQGFEQKALSHRSGLPHGQEVESPLETQPEEHDSVPENPPILDEEHPLGEDFYGGAVEDGHHAAYDDDEFAMGGGPEHEEAHGEAERVAESNTQEAYTEEDDYLESLSDLREGAIEGEHLENDVPSEHGPIGDAIPGEGEEVEPRAEDDDEIDVTGMDGDSPVRKPKRKSSKSKKAPKEKTPSRRSTMSSDFLSALSGSGGSSRSKKKKIDPNKPLIVDGAPVNPMSEPAKPNAYGYDPAMDIVALGKGQLKSAYRRTKTQLDTPQIDAKKYRIEIKHDHLLDDEDAPPMTSEHDDLEAPDSPGPSQRLGDLPIQFSPLPPHHPARIVPPSPPPSGKVDPPPPRRASFMPAMISPVSTGRRVSAGNGTGWEGNGSGRKRRLSDRPDEEPAARQTRLSMAEQFPMGAPKIIDAPLRLGSGPAPSASTTPSRTSGEEGTNGRTSAVTPSSSFSGPSTPNGSRTEGGRARERDPKNLSLEAFISRLQYLTYDLKECNRALATNAVSNGN